MEKTWGFYGRRTEVAEIGRILDSGRWFFCAISGRRRIGKTSLIQQALRERPETKHFYFQVPDSDERGVVQAFQDAGEDYGARNVSVARTFAHVADIIAGLNKMGHVIIIDEFQYFHRKALSPFTSFLQAEVDKLRDTTKGGLFVLGSIHTEMTAILEDRASPLFNRVTHRIEIGHWDFPTLFEMFAAHNIDDPAHQLFLWTLFEGVPKFYRDCFDRGLLPPHRRGLPNAETLRQTTLRKLFFEGSSPLRDEADNWFLRELRGRYDSVLKLLAKEGACSYGELKAEYNRAGGGEKQLGGYLHTLIERYRMVEKLHPIFAGDKARKARYVIADNFLAAWLKAIARNVQMARIQPMEKPVARADESLKTQEGHVFEKMIRQTMEESSRKGVGDFSLTETVRGYWNKTDASDIEIDIVALNKDDKRLRLGSCKRSAQSHDAGAMAVFEEHCRRFLATKDGRRFSGWRVEKALFAPEFPTEQRRDLESRGYICRDLVDFRRYLYP
jgi:AAA+ ATPase superfamily predicted ATPase